MWSRIRPDTCSPYIIKFAISQTVHIMFFFIVDSAFRRTLGRLVRA